MLPNPWVIIGIIGLWLASLVSVGFWQHGAGIDAQTLVDAKEFKRIDDERTEQKRVANVTLRKALEKNIAVQLANDKRAQEQEKENAKLKADFDDIRRKYVGVGLRFPAAESPGHRPGGASALPAGTDTAVPAAAAVLQLPDSVTANLRQLAYEADQVTANYDRCYQFAEGRGLTNQTTKGESP